MGLNCDKKGKFVYLERLRRIKFCNLCRYIRVSKGGYATACYYVTSFMIKTSGKIGQCIVEEESAGKVWAEYEANLIKSLSACLTEIFGRGFSEAN